MSLAQRFAAHVAADDRFEVAAPHPFSLVCFRLKAGDAPSEALLDRINASGRFYLTHTRVNGYYVLRLAVRAPQTTESHVDEAWSLLATAATELLAT